MVTTTKRIVRKDSALSRLGKTGAVESRENSQDKISSADVSYIGGIEARVGGNSTQELGLFRLRILQLRLLVLAREIASRIA